MSESSGAQPPAGQPPYGSVPPTPPPPPGTPPPPPPVPPVPPVPGSANPYGQPFGQGQPYQQPYAQQPYTQQQYAQPQYAPPAPQPLSPSDERLYGMLAYLVAIIAGFVAPLVVFLIFKDRSDFVRRVSREALNLQITAAIVSIALMVIWLVGGFTLGVLIPPLGILLFVVGIIAAIAYGIAVLVFNIIGAMRANSGQVYKVPAILRLVK